MLKKIYLLFLYVIQDNLSFKHRKEREGGKRERERGTGGRTKITRFIQN